MRYPALAALAALGLSSLPPAAPQDAALLRAGEDHLRNVRQLTFDGENAEGYWSPDGARLIYQRSAEGVPCDQEFILDLATGQSTRVSNGQGKTTCGFFMDGGRRVLYASTHLADAQCPPKPDYSRGYVWLMYPGYEIFTSRPDGGDVKRLTSSPGYDAEATVSPDGKTIVFTSTRDGDLEVYTMKSDGTGVRRLTDAPGYDGGPVFSPDGKKIAWRHDAPADAAALKRYRDLLDQGLYAPGVLELWVMDVDGSHKKQVTALGAASFAPAFHPDGKRLIFASNHPEPRGRNFDLYLVGLDGGNLERITTDATFDGFPMFSPDGKRLVFASNRAAKVKGETDLFVAEWVEHPSPAR